MYKSNDRQSLITSQIVQNALTELRWSAKPLESCESARKSSLRSPMLEE